MRAIVSTWALMQYDPELFSDMTVPNGVDRDTLIDRIMIDVGTIGIIYPDPVFMRKAVGIWSRSRRDAWDHMASVLSQEYEPLYNKDAYFEESGTDTLTHGKTTTASGTDVTETVDTPRVARTTVTEPKDVTTDSVVGYNSTSWTNSDKSERSGTITEREQTPTGTDTRRHEYNAGVAHTESGDDVTTFSHKRREYGNIGITSSQQLATAEIELRAKYNIYDIIVDEYKSRFCVMVY